MVRFVAIGAVALMSFVIVGPSVAAEDASEAGLAIFKRAGCSGCHKWHGDGGGGYGGAALSLRKTALDKEIIEMTVRCGRPGTGMPYFLRESYPTDPTKPIACYGLTREDLTHQPLAQGGVFLKPEEIEAVADYVVRQVKGKGEPNLADCVAFFGKDSSACEMYQPPHRHAMPTPSTTQ